MGNRNLGKWVLVVLLGLVITSVGIAQEPNAAPTAAPTTAPSTAFDFTDLPALPRAVRGAFVGTHGGALIVAGGVHEQDGQEVMSQDVYVLPGGASGWQLAGMIDAPTAWGAAASTGQGVVIVGGQRGDRAVADVALLKWVNGTLVREKLPDLPNAAARSSAAAIGSKVHVALGRSVVVLDLAKVAQGWTELAAAPPQAVSSPALVNLQGVLYLFGIAQEADNDGDGVPDFVAYKYEARPGWRQLTAPPRWAAGAAVVPFGHAHIFVFGGSDAAGAGDPSILAYHAITDRWLTLGELPGQPPQNPRAIIRGDQVTLISSQGAMTIKPRPVETNYGWIDHTVVVIYLLGMIAMGWYFVGREKSTKDYFRGGQRVPWWATGMSLFATGASAISLMSMPGKSYSTDWTYFAISIFSLVVLPISLFLLTPLVRRLNIATANEYLERRFGVVARLFASTIYIFTQVCGRMAPVMLLPSIALASITGVNIWICILIMGAITTLYTFLGGLEAVIWTDTVQGFVMCAAVAGCLILALVKLGAGPDTFFDATTQAGKLHIFDWSPSIIHATALVFFINTFVLTVGGIGDQNFVQRVQCTPTLKQAKLAVATQLAVAVPINVLLFGLGTTLWLFYRSRPELLDPAMQTDGIYPFFVAQQLPVGVSGLVVAALLAATMSTISSSICAVSDLGVNDFYRRFSTRATDHSSLILGRVLMAAVGIAGTGMALFLSLLKSQSIWDLALWVTGLISNGIIGLFWLGLLTRRANELGALVGVVFGMVTVLLCYYLTPVHFLLYQAIGAVVTIVTGYLFSLLIPRSPRDLAGLTVYTLPKTELPPREAPEQQPVAVKV